MSASEHASNGPSTMSAFEDALRNLQDRLRSLRFPVEEILASYPELDGSIGELEQDGAVVPPPLRLLWGQVGRVSFVDIPRYRHVEFWKDHGVQFATSTAQRSSLPQFCDGVVVEAPVSRDWFDLQRDEFDDQRERGERLAFLIAPDRPR